MQKAALFASLALFVAACPAAREPTPSRAPSASASTLAAPATDPTTSPEVGEGQACTSPRDCPSRGPCIVAVLGLTGCLGQTCCGAQECFNGCGSDAECPSCRPRCTSGRCNHPDHPF